MYAVALCFINYEDDILDGSGGKLIKYACGRWLHLDCAEDCSYHRLEREGTLLSLLHCTNL